MSLSVNTSTLLENGIQWHSAGNTVEAMACYRQILLQEPDHAEALHLAGVLAYDEGRFDAAKDLMARALTLDGENPACFSNYGLVLEALGVTDAAIEQFKHALAMAPDFVDAALNLLTCYQKTKQFMPAIYGCHQALRRYSNGLERALFLEKLGELYQARRKSRWAMLCFENALALNPDAASVRIKLGELYQGIGRIEDAIPLYAEAFSLNPGLPQVREKLAWCLVTLGRLEDAASILVGVLQENPDAGTARVYLSFCQSVMGFYGNPQTLWNGIYPELLPNVSFFPGCRTGDFLPDTDNDNALDIDVVIVAVCSLYEFGGGQNPSQIARALAEQEKRVLFIQPSPMEYASSRSTGEPFPVYADVFLGQKHGPTSFQRDLLYRVVNAFTRPGKPCLFAFTFFSEYIVGMADLVQEMGHQVAYWCLDDWALMGQQIGNPDLQNRSLELTLAQKADTVIATSLILQKKLEQDLTMTCHRIANGFSSENFAPFTVPPPIPEDLQMGQEKTFIYWGHLTAPWMDWDLLAAVAARHPEWTFNLIGHTSPTRRAEGPNLHYLGQKRVEELAPYGFHADIGFIHFKNDALIQAVNPVKAYEYLACGLPIISTPMPELAGFPLTFQVNNADEFEAAVHQIDYEPIDRVLCQEFLAESSWQARARALLQLAETRLS